MRISDWSSDVCSSDLVTQRLLVKLYIQLGRLCSTLPISPKGSGRFRSLKLSSRPSDRPMKLPGGARAGIYGWARRQAAQWAPDRARSRSLVRGDGQGAGWASIPGRQISSDAGQSAAAVRASLEAQVRQAAEGSI